MRFLSFTPSPTFHACAERKFAPTEIHVTRQFNDDVLILMLEGELTFLENGKLIKLTAGEYYIQEKELIQEGYPIQYPPRYYFVHFVGSFNEQTGGFPIRGSFDPESVLPILHDLDILNERQNENPFMMQSHFTKLLGTLSSHIRLQTDEERMAYRIRNLIETDYASAITNETLAKQFGYSSKSICRLFLRYFGTTPHRYCTNLRLEQAGRLLMNTQLSAEQIALVVGFSEFSSFFRSFRARYGCSPGKYRKKT